MTKIKNTKLPLSAIKSQHTLLQSSRIAPKKSIDLSDKAIQRILDVASVMDSDTKLSMEKVETTLKLQSEALDFF